ncbi:MAG: hypothetical protein GY801_29665 [bacterium]|nr:hypothetical protein [bacterium]
MTVIEKQYIVDEKDRKIAVQLDIETSEKIEEVLENYALAQLMEEAEAEPALGLENAKRYYQQLDKAS